MAWSLKGNWIETCSCEMLCPCYFSPEANPDQGWCSSALGLSVRQGNSNGVDLSNTSAVVAMDFPGSMALGGGTGRVYLDEGMSPEQQRELDAILSGARGGVWEAMLAAIGTRLPTKVAKLSLDTGASPVITVSGAGEITLERIKDEGGNQTTITHAPTMAAFGAAISELATTRGQWNDPEMRTWQAGGSGSVMQFDWSGE